MSLFEILSVEFKEMPTIMDDLMQLREQIDAFMLRYNEKNGLLAVDDKLRGTMQHLHKTCHCNVEIVYVLMCDHASHEHVARCFEGKPLNKFGILCADCTDIIDVVALVETVKKHVKSMPRHIDIVSKSRPSKRLMDLARILGVVVGYTVRCIHDGCDAYFGGN